MYRRLPPTLDSPDGTSGGCEGEGQYEGRCAGERGTSTV